MLTFWSWYFTTLICALFNFEFKWIYVFIPHMIIAGFILICCIVIMIMYIDLKIYEHKMEDDE